MNLESLLSRQFLPVFILELQPEHPALERISTCHPSICFSPERNGFDGRLSHQIVMSEPASPYYFRSNFFRKFFFLDPPFTSPRVRAHSILVILLSRTRVPPCNTMLRRTLVSVYIKYNIRGTLFLVFSIIYCILVNPFSYHWMVSIGITHCKSSQDIKCHTPTIECKPTYKCLLVFRQPYIF